MGRAGTAFCELAQNALSLRASSGLGGLHRLVVSTRVVVARDTRAPRIVRWTYLMRGRHRPEQADKRAGGLTDQVGVRKVQHIIVRA